MSKNAKHDLNQMKPKKHPSKKNSRISLPGPRAIPHIHIVTNINLVRILPSQVLFSYSGIIIHWHHEPWFDVAPRSSHVPCAPICSSAKLKKNVGRSEKNAVETFSWVGFLESSWILSKSSKLKARSSHIAHGLSAWHTVKIHQEWHSKKRFFGVMKNIRLKLDEVKYITKAQLATKIRCHECKAVGKSNNRAGVVMISKRNGASVLLVSVSSSHRKTWCQIALFYSLWTCTCSLGVTSWRLWKQSSQKMVEN